MTHDRPRSSYAGRDRSSVSIWLRDLRVNPEHGGARNQRLSESGVLTVKRAKDVRVGRSVAAEEVAEERDVARRGDAIRDAAIAAGAELEEAEEALTRAFERVVQGAQEKT